MSHLKEAFDSEINRLATEKLKKECAEKYEELKKAVAKQLTITIDEVQKQAKDKTVVGCPIIETDHLGQMYVRQNSTILLVLTDKKDGVK